MSKTKIQDLWTSDNEADLMAGLDGYWGHVLSRNLEREKSLAEIHKTVSGPADIGDWYTFLFEEYFPWKYTDDRRLNRCLHYFKAAFENDQQRLAKIIDAIFQKINQNSPSILESLKQVVSPGSDGYGINGLGVAGASGILSILKPEHFGTVDQVVVEGLKKVVVAPNLKAALIRMKPEGLSIKDGVILIEIMQQKASELNQKFNTDFWTPRKVDMLLWGVRS